VWRSVLFLVFGLGASAIGIHVIRWNARLRRWPTVRGTVVERSIRAHGDLGPRARHAAEISYRYEVNGSQYMGTRIQPSRILESKPAAQRRLDATRASPPFTTIRRIRKRPT
jgi:hypothetical protein